jgi:hypothetical protein
MCLKTETTYRYSCGHSGAPESIDYCQDYFDTGDCATGPEYWEEREPVRMGSTRTRTECSECVATKLEKEKAKIEVEEAASIKNEKGQKIDHLHPILLNL